ncbi:uncharacterized protein LOC122086170 isoform X2 [Macadamia integrifolia]|uniref:uncharacterized protein LOC122086170 isoform X2 n=1 Tax=Macadamia integrifolia TaxID=60698 RepID=UPI001C4E6499|nr:uncharacterized protein LOC122086170 isoform X2 [Macadamia integrifolia]
MTNQGERSFMNSEAHRLKNRMRQQRNDMSALNLEAAGARDGTGSVEFGDGHTENLREGCSQSSVEAESFQAKTIMGQQPQQQHSDFRLFGNDAEDDADIATGDHQTYYSQETVQPLSKMQNEYGVNSLIMQGGYVMNPLDQRQHLIGLNDIMARRLKNRERQRRYRARKRLEADMSSNYLLSQASPLQLEPQLKGGMNKCMARIHSPRDWKQDARKGQASEGQESTSIGHLLLAPNVVKEVQEQAFVSEERGDGKFQSEQLVCSSLSEVNGVRHGRRDWKAAARNKVD